MIHSIDMDTMFTNEVVAGTTRRKKGSESGNKSRNQRPKLFRRQKILYCLHKQYYTTTKHQKKAYNHEENQAHR